MRTAPLTLAALLAALTVAQSVEASTLIARNARNVRLTVDSRGMAVVHYRESTGRVRHVLAWDASNDDVKFKLDYAGGWGSFRKQVWKSVKSCLPYDGPELQWVVKACKAPDGSYWAVQRWQRMLRNQGYRPVTSIQKAWELHLSHWTGELPKLEIYLDWIYGGKYHHLFGRYTYRGKAVHGFRATATGIPLDPYGRNIYLDVFNSAYGPGWKRENSFLAHRPRGNFCYGFYPRPSYYDRTRRPAGHGRAYRATAIGPGVAPDVFWSGRGLGGYDPVYEAEMNALGDEIAGDDRLCRQH
jgi:hypothetical protein